MKMLSFALTAVLALFASVAGQAALHAAADERVNTNLVKIYVTSNSPSYHTPWQMKGQNSFEGSGCIIDGGLVLTNAHVVSDRTFITVKRSGQTKKYVADVKFVAHECDLAVLEVQDQAFFPDSEPLRIGELPEVGDEVSVYGYPGGAEQLTVTRGVVSRVSHETYVHGSAYLLCCQIDASINYGNSGGPVIADGRVVGVAMMVGWGENEGFMVSVPVIRHFLDDIQDGSYDGIPDPGLWVQAMENDALRRYHRVPGDEDGVLVRRVFPDAPAGGLLHPGDVILAVDGVPVACDGTVAFRREERTSYLYLFQRKQIGKTAVVRVLRDGVVREVPLKLSAPSEAVREVPYEQYDVRPAYYVYGGIVFTPLTENFLMEFDDGWCSSAPIPLTHAAYYREPDPERREVVIIADVLADEINMGYEDVYWEIVDLVNGRKVTGLRELVELLESNRGNWQVIETERGDQIVLDRREAKKSRRRIMKQYSIEHDRSENLR